MIIKTNALELNSLNSLKKIEIGQANTLKKMSSGKRINVAADDAAGSAMKETKQALIRGSEQALRNTQDGISLVQTAEGGINNIQAMAHRMRELTIEAANDTVTSEDRKNIQEEINHLNKEITSIAKDTAFNGKNLLAKESGDSDIIIHVSSQPAVQVVVELTNLTADSLGTSSVDVSNAAAANSSITIVDNAIRKISDEQTKFGSYQSRFEHISKNLDLTTVNTYDSQSRIVDADMAAEVIELAKYNILNASTNLMLANANQKPENVLRLIEA